MGKNITIYLKDDQLKEMDKLREVNWSEVCRNAIEEYVKLRSDPTLEPYLRKLSKQAGEEYSKGVEFAVKRILAKTNYRELDQIVAGIESAGVSHGPDEYGDEISYSQEEIERNIVREVARVVEKYSKDETSKEIPILYGNRLREKFTDAFIQGVQTTLKDAWNRVKAVGKSKG